jgi:hypothetical protein
MSRRSPGQTKQLRKTQQAKRKSGWPLASVVVGLLLICIAVLNFELTGRTILFWLSRDDYIRTDLKVTELSPGRHAMVFGIVAATGEEFHSRIVPAELIELDSPSDPTGTLMKPERAKGKVVPIWFAQDHNSFFSSRRVQYVSEFPTLPSGTLVLGTAAVNLSIFAIGACLTAFGVWLAYAKREPSMKPSIDTIEGDRTDASANPDR